MTANPYHQVAAEMRRNPATVDKRTSGVIEDAIADAVDRCESTRDAGALVAEIIHIASMAVIRISAASHGGHNCAGCLNKFSYQFDRTLECAAESELKKHEGGLN
ncbi:hypothetical protein H9Q09_00805 [Aurantimonas sp. DM33-3]|uniref:hypothetical protein n=1 Tax=Aurantimonas sp. DM33-3 TaxID=2766955 RepID=UPI00165211C3|nr:hypothetical protein [Aurantimonas sp. DM33-3]MBC6714723.1 hypothetical protein [Aurantimonas sp. DM33-3]